MSLLKFLSFLKKLILDVLGILLLIIITSAVGQNATFCSAPYQPKLCPGLDHVACINYFNTQQRCPDDATVVDLSYLKDWIVAKHNWYRNYVAGGYLDNLPSAAAMPTLVSQILENVCELQTHRQIRLLYNILGMERPIGIFCTIKRKHMCIWSQ